MSRGLVERISSDLGHISYSSTATRTGDDINHQCTSNNKQRLALLFSGARRRSEATTTAGAESSGKKKHAQGSSKRGGGLDNIGPLLKKYMAMAEQLFASFSSGGSSGGRDREYDRRRRSPANTLSSSKRHGGIRLFSAPASPANSGRLSARGVIMPRAAASGQSTAEDLQSAIAHCKNSSSVAAAAEAEAKRQQAADGGDRSTVGVN